MASVGAGAFLLSVTTSFVALFGFFFGSTSIVFKPPPYELNVYRPSSLVKTRTCSGTFVLATGKGTLPPGAVAVDVVDVPAGTFVAAIGAVATLVAPGGKGLGGKILFGNVCTRTMATTQRMMTMIVVRSMKSYKRAGRAGTGSAPNFPQG